MFKRIKRILLLSLALIAILAGFKFSVDNEQPLQLILFGWHLPSIPIGFWILCTLLLGCLTGLALGYLPNAFNRRSLKIKDSKIRRLEEQLKTLRKKPKN